MLEHTHTGAPLSLALLDIDHFKQVNDQLGHAVGDEVLIEVVRRLAATTRSAGMFARVGGEEFALLLPGTAQHDARQLVERALADLRATPFAGVGTVTASAGVAQLAPPMSDGTLYRLADRLMYEAKSRGRDQVC